MGNAVQKEVEVVLGASLPHPWRSFPSLSSRWGRLRFPLRTSHKTLLRGDMSCARRNTRCMGSSSGGSRAPRHVGSALLSWLQASHDRSCLLVLTCASARLLADLDDGESIHDWARDHLSFTAPKWRHAERRWVRCLFYVNRAAFVQSWSKTCLHLSVLALL